MDLEALGVDSVRALEEMAYVGAEGVRYGASAWAAALRTGPLPWRLVARVMEAPGARVVASKVYRWIADNRHRLPGGTPACAMPPPASSGE